MFERFIQDSKKIKIESHKMLLMMQDEFSRNQKELKIQLTHHQNINKKINEFSSFIGLNSKNIENYKLDSLMFCMIYLPEFNASTATFSLGKLKFVNDVLKSYIADWKLYYNSNKKSLKLIDNNQILHINFLND